MGSQCRRQGTFDRKRIDHSGQSSRPVAQVNEDRLRLRMQRYAEKQAEKRTTSGSQHVTSESPCQAKVAAVLDENNTQIGKWAGMKPNRAKRSFLGS
ncbi:hypothetical protein R1sor_026518 [Riccia sorocarpa]|uniref:Uncharacterized protein n=1 Tax=Riccia sorocarpa TaxID=122646 RepID=A0ABD3GEX3_9MARC